MSWRRCGDLPVAISVPQVVRVEDHVYVGGGMKKQGDTQNIFQYSFTHGTWTSLPDYPTYQHGLATLNDELLLIGGNVSGGTQVTNTVYTFRGDTWKEILPPMPTPRYYLSTVSHDNRLIIAAGGTTCKKNSGESFGTDVVEIYLKDRQWYSTKRLPFPISTFSMSIIGGKCYTVGGVGATRDVSNTTLYTTVSSLLENAVPADSKYTTPQIPVTWKKLQDKHPLLHTSPVEMNGRLTAVGGSLELMSRRGTNFISIYDFATDTWVECKGAELPLPLYRTGLLKLDDNKVMVVGGQTKSQQFSAAVFIGSYENTL